jgi:hypothetical protein
MRADVPTEAEVMALLEKFSNACALRDTEDALRLFAQDDDILFVGSEAGKRSRGPKEIRAVFERLFSREDILLELGVAFGVGSRTGGVGDQGWRWGGEHLPYRVSAVFERCGEGWALRLVHGFEPAVAYQETSG